jgi:hypothetical protein
MEIRKNIPGYEGLYQASIEGRIRGLDRKDSRGRRVHGKIKEPVRHKAGYLYCMMYDSDGRNKNCTVHSLVASAFLGRRCHDMVIDHIDNNKGNNRPENLRYVTQTENLQNSKRWSYRKCKTGPQKSGNNYSCFCRGKYIGMFPTVGEAEDAYEYAIKNGEQAAREKFRKRKDYQRLKVGLR